MGGGESEVTYLLKRRKISSKILPSGPLKWVLLLLFVAICSYFWGLEIDSENADNGIDCDNPDTFVGYEGLRCDAASNIQFCCVIIPLLLTVPFVVLILSNISPYEEKEE